MRRKNGTKWDRNRYHQIQETIIGSRSEHKDNTFTKKKTARKERRNINMQCHKARFNPDVGLDIHHEPGRPGWDYFCTPRIRYVAEKGEMPRMYGCPHSPEQIELSAEELRRLPAWVQHQIKDNIVQASNIYRYVSRYAYWQLPEYEQDGINGRAEQSCYQYIRDLQDEQRYNPWAPPEEKDSPEYYRPYGTRLT